MAEEMMSEGAASEGRRWRDLPARALDLYLGLPRRVQYALIVALLGGGARLSGADVALLDLLFPSPTIDAPAALEGRCSGREPAGLDEERADMEALER